ncbi:hypothetical protein A0U87_21805 [Sphingobium sp. MP9-4]|uniref:nuclear transport factor 2 family protein n=1 Tax=Sphingobium sp. MP9-4 TaxID=1761936 RepID=UPI0010CA72ED|nr:nuclear transport factor 2 family protein [Sphingobium sp. MP9-4]TKV41334.1 hypothetical protein A0U87_21805 [Sphingobium sp. MP9-4]
MDAEFQAVVDHHAIRACLARLARGEDRRDATLIRQCWWPQARFDYGVYSGDFEAYLAWVVPGAEAIANTQHLLGQSHVEIEGDQARAETHVLSYHRVIIEGEARDTCIGGRYLDLLAKREGVWRIAERTMLYDWEQDWGAAADWTSGVMGYPFTAGHFTGRAHGDFSLAWFAGKSA